ncbi:MAG TPA: hypothetical protein VGO66_07375 [Solirubrobacterales bacterium]|jgi:hypothetical protein|nr:hypothetical protein [Solirubrobacterales bacterium]
MAGRAAAALMACAAALVLAAPAGAAEAPDPNDPSNPFTFGNPEFCTPDGPVNDFGISHLPPLLEAPDSGDLPFGPKTVSIDFAAGPILTPGMSAGFWLHSENYSGHTPLHWALRNRIRAVDAAGSPGKVLSRGKQRVRLINAAREVKLFLEPPRAPGFYRYEVEIADFDGKHLATYSSYLRVERKLWDPRLGLSGNQFHPGDQVLSRVENFGTEPIVSGEEFRLQRYVGGAWFHRRIPDRDGWLLWLGYTSAGGSGRCTPLSLPLSFPPGQYRIVKEVGWGSWPDGGPPQFLAAPFEVTP